MGLCPLFWKDIDGGMGGYSPPASYTMIRKSTSKLYAVKWYVVYSTSSYVHQPTYSCADQFHTQWCYSAFVVADLQWSEVHPHWDYPTVFIHRLVTTCSFHKILYLVLHLSGNYYMLWLPLSHACKCDTNLHIQELCTLPNYITHSGI